jgi:hypothetical protein
VDSLPFGQWTWSLRNFSYLIPYIAVHFDMSCIATSDATNAHLERLHESRHGGVRADHLLEAEINMEDMEHGVLPFYAFLSSRELFFSLNFWTVAFARSSLRRVFFSFFPVDMCRSLNGRPW